jgi:hypothetical protein
VKLDPDDVEAIARRVAELLGTPPAGALRYVDAAGLARALGVDREWIYAHAAELGALRLGGPRGRLRFDLEHVRRTLADDGPTAGAPRPGGGAGAPSDGGRRTWIVAPNRANVRRPNKWAGGAGTPPPVTPGG